MNGEQFLNWCMTHYGEVITLVILIVVGTGFLLYKLATKPTHEQNTNFTNKGTQSAPIVQGNGTVVDIVMGNKEEISAPVVVGGDVTFGDKTTHIHQAPVEKETAEKRHALVDKMVEKIRQSCQSSQNPTVKVRDKFECMVRCLTLANASQSLDEAMEFLIRHKWTSPYGSLSHVRSQLGLATNDYSAAGSAYYKVTPRRAVELGLDAVEVQNEVWNELSCDERMVLVLYGATRLHYRIEDQSNELRGTGLEFSLLVGPHPGSKQFDIMRVAYRLLADESRDIADIIVEEHARCQAEKARTGRK